MFMYKPDLSPFPIEKEHQAFGTLCVGWLTKKEPYSQGWTSEEFRERLFAFCLRPVFMVRGFHVCEFCSPPPKYMICVERGGRKVWLGNAQIRVFYQDWVYAAPNLIYHYVTEHQYRPPEEFIEAVLKGPLPGSPEYEAFLDKWARVYGWPELPMIYE